jgi:hypothetical protein
MPASNTRSSRSRVDHAAAKEERSFPCSHFLLFTCLGFGTGWTMCDATMANMAWLMARLPESMQLPTHVDMVGNIGIAVTLVCVWITLGLGYQPNFAGYQRGLWLLYALGLLASLLLGSLWWVLLQGLAIFVYIPIFMGTTIGTLTVSCVYPLSAVFFDDAVIPALLFGDGVGSLVAGSLGVVQGVDPHFAPMALMGIVAVLIAAACTAWLVILRGEIGRRPPERPSQGGALNATSKGKAARSSEARQPDSVSVSVGSPVQPLVEKTALLSASSAHTAGADAGASAAWRTTAAEIVRLSAPLWALQAPTTAVTWGLAAPALQFATAYAGCDCDTRATVPAFTYALSFSSSFILMPFGALLAHALPLHTLRSLGLLVGVQLVLAIIQLLGIAGVPFMRCSKAASIFLIVSTATMRTLDTYLTTLLYQLIARRFASHGERVQTTASLVFGQFVIVPKLLLGGGVMFTLVQTGVVHCVL